LAKVANEQEAAARATLRLLDLPGLPPFVSEALYTILSHAAKVKGVAIGSDAACGYSVKALATLYAVTSGFQRGLTFEPARDPSADLAALISAVLTHPDTPTRIYDKLTDALVEMHDATDVYDDPRAVRALLDYHARQREESEE
jgi:hypothetical protein